ncbi:hypothetical protein Q9966_012683, partial [Columba livia]
MEVLKYSDTSLQSVAQGGAKVLEAISESVTLASDVTTIPESANQADLNTVKVAHMAVAVEEVKIPEATEKCMHMGNVERLLELGGVSRPLETTLKPSITSDNLRVMQCSTVESSGVLKADVSLQRPLEIPAATAVTQVETKSAKIPLEPGAVTKVKDIEPARSSVHMEEALQPVAVVKAKTSETIIEPLGVKATDIKAAQECLQVEVVKGVEGTTDPASVLNASILTETGNVDRTQQSAVSAESKDVNVVAEAKDLRATLQPVAVGQTFPQTTPGIQMVESSKGPRATVDVAALTGIKDRETSQATLQLENTNASQISESTLKPVAVIEAKDSEGTSLLRQPEERESNVRGLEVTPLSWQKDRKGPGSSVVSKSSEINLDSIAGIEAGSGARLLAMQARYVRLVKNLETTVRPVAETERKASEADLGTARAEMKTTLSHLHMKGVRGLGDPASVGMANIQALEAVLQPGTLAVARENVLSEARTGDKVLEASPGVFTLEERSERTPESVVARASIAPVREFEALGGMHLKTTTEREPKHAETGAEPLGASTTKKSIVSQSQVVTHTRTSQTEVVGDIRDSELATSSASVEVKGLDNSSEVEAVSEVKDVEAQLKTSPLHMKNLEMAETRTLMQGLERTLASEVVREIRHSDVAPEYPNKAEVGSQEAVLEPVQTVMVQTSETSSKSAQEQIVGHSETVLESFSGVEEKTMTSEITTEGRNLKGTLESNILTDVRTQGPAAEYAIATRRESTPKNEPSLTDLKDLSATVEVKGSETVEESEVHMDIQGLETSRESGDVGVMNVLGYASEAVPEALHTEKQEHLQAVLEAKPAAEWKSTEAAPEILTTAEIETSDAVPKPGDVKDPETMLEREVAAEVQYAEGVQSQQMEDMRVLGQAQECKIVVEKDAEQISASESLITETVFSSSHAAGEKDSAGTEQLEAAPALVTETKDLETAPFPETVELKDAEAAVGLEAETKDLEAALAPETVTGVPVLAAETSQSEVIPEAEAVKEATPEEESEKRDSETSDVQPDVAARMKETLMRLEKVIEKSSHRSSDKKHDAKKQKRSRSKSQSRSRKRKKKSRSRSTSRRLTSKRARSRSRNYSDSRKKHSKSRSPSVEKRERRVSSRRSRRRRSRSSDHYRSKSRSAEKRGSRLSSGRSRRRRSRSSDRYRSKSRSVEKRLSSRRSRRRRSRSSDRYRSKSRSVEIRLSSRRSGRRHSRSSDRYRSKSRSVEKRLSSRRSGRRRSRSSDRYRSKSRSVEKRLSSRRSGRRRSRSSDRYRSKSRSVEKRLSSRRSGRRRSRSSDCYRSKSRSVEKRGSRLSPWRSRRRRSRSSDRSKSRSRSSEKRGGKEYSWRFRHRGSGSSDRSKSRSRSLEKRGRKTSLRRSKRQRSKSSDRYKSRSRSVEKRDRKQSSRKSKRQRSKSSDRYKSRSKSV